MTTQIKFGTSGWRAVMAEEFTFHNVRRAVHGIARYVKSQRQQGARVVVGRDPRFLGETFCSIASEILSRYGITPLIIAEPAPTPAISYAVIHEKADGAINFTASHNPPEYNGIKFSTPDGAPPYRRSRSKSKKRSPPANNQVQNRDPRLRPRASIPSRHTWLACAKQSTLQPSRKLDCAWSSTRSGVRLAATPIYSYATPV